MAKHKKKLLVVFCFLWLLLAFFHLFSFTLFRGNIMDSSFLILATFILFLGVIKCDKKKGLAAILGFAAFVLLFLSLLTVGSIQHAL
jgi:uncharacterized protein involved in response to NO